MGGERILVVEDKVVTASHIQATLCGFGYDAQHLATSGEAALEKSLSFRPDLILMDIMLAGAMDGVEAAQRLHEHMDVPIVFLSAYSDKSMLDRAKISKPFGYLLKPFRPEELRTTIEVALYKHKADRSVRESEQRLELALKGADLVLWDFNLQKGAAVYDAEAFSMFGFSADEIEPEISMWGRLVHQDDANRVRKAFNAHAKGKLPLFECEYRMRHKTGDWLWVIARGKVTERDFHGNPLRMIGTFCDITPRKTAETRLQEAYEGLEKRVMERTAELTELNTEFLEEIRERKRAEDKLIQAERRYRSIFEESRDAIVIVRPGGQIVDANEACAELFATTLDDIVGQEIHRFSWIPSHHTVFVEEIAKRGFITDFEWLVRNKNEKRICLASSSLRRDEEGHITAYLSIVRDVTEARRFEENLRQAQKMEAIGTLAGGIAHDFNNLLQAILGYSDLLLTKKGPSDPEREKLQVIQQAARNGADLVSRILTFSRKAESKKLPMDLNESIRKAHKLLLRTVPRMIETKLVLAETLQIIDADPAQMEQILLNLGINAQHAMPDGGTLLIETNNVSLSDQWLLTHLGAKPGHYVLLTVSDTGVGIEPDVLDRIFEPFFTTKMHEGGTGLGLSMVHGIVSQHGGHIRCYSEPGRGTSFKIYLPVSAHGLKSDPTLTREMPAFGTETILLVDDDDRVREMGRQMLEMGGYQVIVSQSGEEALELYGRHGKEISLIILDLVMPGMGGTRCLEELLRIDPDIRVLVASGFSSNGLVHEHEGSGRIDFINKPYDAKEILGAIRTVLDRGHR